MFRAKTVELIDSIVLDSTKANYTWPLKKTANMDGEITLGGLHMIHERKADLICGPIMPQGGKDYFQYLNFSFCIETKLKLWPLQCLINNGLLHISTVKKSIFHHWPRSGNLEKNFFIPSNTPKKPKGKLYKFLS